MLNTSDICSDIRGYGISDIKKIYYNLSYDELFRHETDPSLEGFEKGFVTESGAVAVDTGIFTGRSPKDKYIVKEETSQKNVWWKNPQRKASDNKPVSEEIWNELKTISTSQLSGKSIYVQDGFAGANENSRIRIRFITEVAWQAHFVKNMFIRPTDEELRNFRPDFVVLNAAKAKNPRWQEQGLNSEVFVVFNLRERMACIGGTWYGGEMKKGIFSIMNYFLPLKGIASMHCSANVGKDGKTAVFFGLSGTGKTTLSADPNRALIGDDEHGWDEDGIFNFEGGCYAKCINLDPLKEPDIFHAIRRDALLENVVFDPTTGKVNYSDVTKTENTRVSYPIYHIDNIVKPVSKSGHARNVIFLTADAFGILPPVAKLTTDQTRYHFISGYTAKVAGTERDICEPVPSFSSCFGAAFLLLDPIIYATELKDKMEKYHAQGWLVNTGWTGGAYGKGGKRIDLADTRKMIDAILNGMLDHTGFEMLPVFNLLIPTAIPGINSDMLNPGKMWRNQGEWDVAAKELAIKFIRNFEKFADTQETRNLLSSGPII